jgi:hypothetical protein
MPWTIREGTHEPNPALDPYRRAAAELLRDGVPVGFLVVEAIDGWVPAGRRRLRPVLVAEENLIASWWLLVPGGGVADFASGDGPAHRQLDDGSYMRDIPGVNGWRWLAENELEAAWERYEEDMGP